MHASQVDQHFNLRPNFELWNRRHYPIILTGMRYNIEGNLATVSRLTRFTGLLFTLCVEFYLYPTVGTVLIHSIKPELTE